MCLCARMRVCVYMSANDVVLLGVCAHAHLCIQASAFVCACVREVLSACACGTLCAHTCACACVCLLRTRVRRKAFMCASACTYARMFVIAVACLCVRVRINAYVCVCECGLRFLFLSEPHMFADASNRACTYPPKRTCLRRRARAFESVQDNVRARVRVWDIEYLRSSM